MLGLITIAYRYGSSWCSSDDSLVENVQCSWPLYGNIHPIRHFDKDLELEGHRDKVGKKVCESIDPSLILFEMPRE